MSESGRALGHKTAETRKSSRTESLRSYRDRLMDLSDDAMRTLSWRDLAAYIDALNEEYQHFSWLINQRKIGSDVPVSTRPKGKRRSWR